MKDTEERLVGDGAGQLAHHSDRSRGGHGVLVYVLAGEEGKVRIGFEKLQGKCQVIEWSAIKHNQSTSTSL